MLAVRQARLVLGASVVSMVGDATALVALLLKLHEEGHGPLAVMALLICFALPIVATMGLAGSVADSHDPRRVLVLALAVQAAGAIGLVVAPSVVWVCAAAVVMQTGFAFANPVWSAVMPRVVGEDLSGTYVSLAQGMRAVASPIGAAVAGVVVEHWGSRTALAVNAASFVGLIGAALALRVGRVGAPVGERERWRRSSLLPRDGVTVLRRDPVLATLVFAIVPLILTIEAVNAVEVFLVRGDLGATPRQYGMAEACAGVGAVLGSFAAAAIRSRPARIRGLLLGIAVVPLAQIVQGLAPTLGAYAGAAFVVGLALGIVNALIFALLLREIGEVDRGKVITLVSGLSRSATIGALTLGGVLGTLVGARTAYVICGSAGLLIAAAAALRVQRPVHRSVDSDSTQWSVPTGR
ncbi:hypothetical protein N803_12990 [Knoellia subterranea KCTC 19937]|uniref:Major facilitator superfamily (MFS) profile domain-containing protein n=1 Tax=Knoellia subterranea KCTC 19937 TaxID=1385521 RepID=A0A0A0JPK0_9MICO|nr:hypothetical protein N803_12990 [Knoellia subterranea KCTC 19937]